MVLVYRFGDFELDTAQMELRGPTGDPRSLGHRAFLTLLYLIDHRGSVIGLRELLDEIRRRSGETARPEEERNYLKRLLDRF